VHDDAVGLPFLQLPQHAAENGVPIWPPLPVPRRNQRP
jgi:hypothetical protein